MLPAHHRLFLVGTAILAWGLVSVRAFQAREFTSADGSKTIEAEIVSVDPKAGTVTLRDVRGRNFDSAISLFSEEDQEVIRNFKPVTKVEKKSVAEQIGDLEEIANSLSQFAKADRKIIPLLNSDTHPAVRRYAARAAGSVPSRDLVDPLIGLLTDRVAGPEAHDSLVRLTEQDIGKDPAAWNLWWDKHRDDFRPVCLSLRKLAALKARADRKKPKPDPTTPLFYGRELTGKNILFLLDISGSMRGARIDRLKMELRSMVELLPEECTFAFIFFPHQQFPEKGLGAATFEFKEKATKVIEGIVADGGTPMGGAVEIAFDLVDAGDPSEPIDTIYLLSDGEPTDNSPQKMRRIILDRNAAHYVLVHTIAIGDESALLKSIAADSGGNHLWSATSITPPDIPIPPGLIP